MELSKTDKKIAREVVEKGLQNEYKNSLTKFSQILKAWETNPVSNQETYFKLYKKVIKFDKHLVHRYDGITSSEYMFIIAAQFVDGVITKEDLEPFSDEIKLKIDQIIKI